MFTYKEMANLHSLLHSIFEITGYLSNLDGTNFYHLGSCLGLRHSSIKDMLHSDTYRTDGPFCDDNRCDNNLLRESAASDLLVGLVLGRGDEMPACIHIQCGDT